MKIVFLGTTGVQHSLLAANIYLRQNEDIDFAALEYYCDSNKDATGFPIYIGDDALGNQVYTLGVGKDLAMGQKTVENLVGILGFSSQDIIIRPVEIKADKLFAYSRKIPPYLGGLRINRFLSNIILHHEYKNIKENVEQFTYN